MIDATVELGVVVYAREREAQVGLREHRLTQSGLGLGT